MNTKKKKAIKISIVVPIYNVENDLRNCLDCLIKQTLKDIEIICIDDASTDNSGAILEEYKKLDPRITVIRHKMNRSASIARKEGAFAAKGEYTLFLDPDDSLEKDAAEILYRTAKETDVEILHFGTNIINRGVTEKQVEWYTAFAKPYTDFLYGEEVFTRCFDTQDYRFNIWNKLIKTALCKKAMAYCVDEPLPKAQDLYAYFLIAYFADSYYGIEDKFYNYAFGGGVSGSKEFTEEKFRRHCSQANVAYHIVRFLIDHGALDKHYRAVLHVISNLINDNIASLRACGKAKVPFRAENIFAEAWVEGMLWQKLSEHIFQEQDRPCARLLFEILFKILKNVSIRTRKTIFEHFFTILSVYPNVLDELICEQDIQNKDYMFLQTIAAAIKAKKYAGRYIPVFMATNDNYAPFLGVTLNSLLLNADRYYFYDIYIFHSGIKDYYISKLDSIQEKDVSVRCLNVKSIITSQNLYSSRHYSVEMYHRFLIPELFFFLQKAVYIDCDTIVLDSIHKLYNIDIGNSVLGAARNLLHKEMYDYVVNKLHHDPEKYINSGVLIINCEQFIQQGIKNKCYAFLRDHLSLECPDQDALNICCKDIRLIDAKWNVQWHHLLNKNTARYALVPNDAKIFADALTDIRLLHFTSNKKPWNYLASEYSDLFWDYASTSVFAAETKFKYRDLQDPLNDKIKDLYVKIGKLTKLLEADEAAETVQPKDKKPSIFRKFFDYLRKYGFLCTLVRIFGGRKRAMAYQNKRNQVK